MLVSAIFGSQVVFLPCSSSLPPTGSGGGGVSGGAKKAAPRLGGVGLVIESSSRPQKKATAHHRKTRPRKTQPWDIRRGPTVYPPLPNLPPEWTLVTEDAVPDAAPPQPLETE